MHNGTQVSLQQLQELQEIGVRDIKRKFAKLYRGKMGPLFHFREIKNLERSKILGHQVSPVFLVRKNLTLPCGPTLSQGS